MIADVCQALAILKRNDEFFLFKAACAGPLMGDQRIGDLPESGRDRSLIRNLRLIPLGLGEAHAGLEAARREDGLCDLRDKCPFVGGAREEVRQTGGLASDCPRQGDLREVRRPGDPDISIGGDQSLLGCANIGPSFEQRRGQTRRYVRESLLD